MSGYGDYCSVARALDLLGERWTLLVVRELLCGSRTFSEMEKGIPRISKTMLAARLRTLADGGLVIRTERSSAAVFYDLTDSGKELFGVVRELGVWGQRWLPRDTDVESTEADAVLFDMARRVVVDALPRSPVVVRIELADARAPERTRYLMVRRAEITLCRTNPGGSALVTLTCDRATLVAWWRGDVTYADAKRRGLSVAGPRALVKAFPTWFKRYLFAEVPLASASRRAAAV